MPSNISNHFKNIIDQFTPEILGVFWLTDDELNRNLSGFNEFNYLFDGLISQYLYGQSDAQTKLNSNIFFTKNFDQKIFLAHIKNDHQLSGILDEQIALIQENTDRRKKILIFNQTKANWISDLSRRYPKFNFVELKLS